MSEHRPTECRPAANRRDGSGQFQRIELWGGIESGGRPLRRGATSSSRTGCRKPGTCGVCAIWSKRQTRFLPVDRYVHPDQFAAWEGAALAMRERRPVHFEAESPVLHGLAVLFVLRYALL